jgi:YggT family protein
VLLVWLVDLYSLVVFASVILSWLSLSPDHPVVRVVGALTEPLLGPIRRVLPDLGGFDFSPLILLAALRIIKSFLVH